MWNLKYDTNELIYKTVTDIENRLVVAKGKWDGGGMDWEFGTNRCKLLSILIEWINIKVLLYSTGNYIQYLVKSHMENKKVKNNKDKQKKKWLILEAE